MKVAITASAPQLEAGLDPRFGRCAFFIIAETETGTWEACSNPAVDAAGGAGTQAAQFVAGKSVQSVVSGNFGPNAYMVLQAAGIKMYAARAGTVESVLADFKAGRLQAVDAPTVGKGRGGRGGRGQGRT
jgi:predicted Fe-Mo cluster-binding NifX family protein